MLGSVDRLNAALDGLRFDPVTGFVGTSWLMVELDDLGHTGLGGSQTDTEVVPILVHNNAPTLIDPGNLGLAAIHDETTPDLNVGTPVFDILASSGFDPIQDADPSSVQGIAIVEADASHGAWQFSLDDGATWQNVPAVGTDHALLLSARPTTRLRFLPMTGFIGAASLTFRAWDRTDGISEGSLDVDPGPGGGNSAYSVGEARATIQIALEDHTPVLMNDIFGLRQGGLLQVRSPGVLANDFEPDGTRLSVEAYTQPKHGHLAMNEDGSFAYAPDADWWGHDTFTYRAVDDAGLGETAMVDLWITPGQAVLPTELEGFPNVPIVIPPASTSAPSFTTSDGGAGQGVDTGAAGICSSSPGLGIYVSDASSSYASHSSSGARGGGGRGSQPKGADVPDASIAGDIQAAGAFTLMPSVVGGESMMSQGWNMIVGILDGTLGRAKGGPAAGAVGISDSEVAQAEASRRDAMAETMLSLDAGSFWSEVDRMGENLTRSVSADATTAVVSTGSAISLGYMLWTMRANSLLAALLAGTPLWKELDPLEVVQRRNAKRTWRRRGEVSREGVVLSIVQRRGPHGTVRTTRTPSSRIRGLLTGRLR
ncbi:MAG: Ig-like domain-containing protein [Isosphaeraceae bacterium]